MLPLMLPLNWQRVRLGDILTLKHGRDYKNFKLGNIPVYGSGGYMLSINNFLHNGESICIGRKGTIDKPIYLNGKFWVVDTLFYSYSFKKSIPKFIFYAFSIIKWSNYNEATGVPSLTKMTISNIEIPLPPLNEQIAIANILSDLDRYLCALDALILKKEGVKKALSFELLSQRKRLKGFNQAWQRVRLGDIILSLKTGLNPRKFFKLNTPNANNYYVTVRELEEYTIKFTHQTDRIDDNALSLCLKRSNLEKDDVLFSGTGTIGKVSIIKENPNNWAIKEGIYSIKPNKKIVFPRFLMFCFENLNIQNDIKSKSSEGIVKSISMNDLQQIIIPLPPLNEQIAIANILSDLDNEIISLKNKKRQFENIKKALNHDLMSAKIRVLEK
ncbi:restriction endonuclease subunit S [Helicobacter pylori]|uniref:restriction endonuclease subunit S n=1 Tax=Helicobacter pylori TaxID=210 RepID=UPI00059B5478|nr:restriction endonuclease subunit S [Helicobacter pylori]